MKPEDNEDRVVYPFQTAKIGWATWGSLPTDAIQTITGGTISVAPAGTPPWGVESVPIIDDVEDEDDRELVQELVIVSQRIDYNSERPEYEYAKAVRSLGWVPGSVAQQAQLQRDDALREVEKLQQRIVDLEAEKIREECTSNKPDYTVAVDPADGQAGYRIVRGTFPTPNTNQITITNTANYPLTAEATQRLVQQLKKRYM